MLRVLLHLYDESDKAYETISMLKYCTKKTGNILHKVSMFLVYSYNTRTQMYSYICIYLLTM